MTADRAIRYSTIGAVSVLALVAAFVSYRHALVVVRAHGESGALALAYPLTIDGLIYAASMVLLNAARQGVKGHWLAYFALGLGGIVPPWPRTLLLGSPTARWGRSSPPGPCPRW